VTVPFVIEIPLTTLSANYPVRIFEKTWASGHEGRAGGLGEAGDDVDVAPVAWAAIGVRVGWSDDDSGEEAELRGGVLRGGDRHKSSSTPTPLSSSASQRLLAAFLMRFAGGGEGVGRGSGGESLGGGDSGGGGLGLVGGGNTGAG
jgi:hypothetical protein